MQRARIKLVLEQPFFGMLVLSQLRVELREDLPAPLATDGKVIYFRSKEINAWPLAVVCAGICHEVLHAANGHVWRCEWRDKWRFNVAADYAINGTVKACGLPLGEGWLFSEKWDGKSAEDIYKLLPKDLTKLGLPNSAAGWDWNDIMHMPGAGTPEGQEAIRQWKQAVQQAAQAAKMQGQLPAALERMVGELVRPVLDWKALLARFIQQASKSDYSWRRLNRRYLSAGIWLPSLWSETMRPIVVAIDTSGSIGAKELQVFVAELNGIIQETQPERVHLLWADAEVAGVQTFERGDPLTVQPKGGGGTDFRPVFEWVKEQAEEDVACVVYLTDMYGTFPSEPCAVPTLWVATSAQVAPWGETIRLEERG